MSDQLKILEKFRLWAFHQYYDHAYRHVEDLTIRFVYALAASTSPIPRGALPKWEKSLAAIKAEQKRMKKEPGVKRDEPEEEEDCVEVEEEEV